jgi:tripartite-type tricarboxylate transporter receptor subunit TctC
MKRKTMFNRLCRLAGALTALALLTLPGTVAAENCPALEGKTLRWIVPYPPGGGYDTYSRLIEPFLEERLGVEIKVENISGAAGLVGTKLISGAEPDGLTLGIINAAGLIAAALQGKQDVPDPAVDFTILGRVVRTRQVIYTGAGSPLKTMEDLFRENQKRPILAAISEVGSITFHNLAIPFHLLGIPLVFIAGYPGSREISLAIIRGEVDLSTNNFESILDRIEAGEIRPLLQVTDEPISSHPSLAGIPVLGGEGGLAAGRAAATGRSRQEILEMSAAIVGMDGAGRLVAAPPGMEEDLSRCLAENLYGVLTDPRFRESAARMNRSLDTAPAAEARLGLEAASRNMEKLIPVIQEAVMKVRR